MFSVHTYRDRHSESWFVFRAPLHRRDGSLPVMSVSGVPQRAVGLQLRPAAPDGDGGSVGTRSRIRETLRAALVNPGRL